VTCVLDAPPALPPDTVARLVRQTLPKVGEWLAPMALATVDRDSVRSLDVAKEAHALASTWLWDDASQGDDAVAERAAFTHDTDEVTLLDTRLAGLASVDRASVAAFVDEWLTERRMALAAVVPGPAPRLETRRIDGRAILDTTASTPWSAPPDPDGLASWTLANGVRVWTLRAAAPISAVETVFPGGFMRDPQPGTDEVVETVATYQLPIDLDVLATRGGVRAAHSFDAWADRLVASSTAENLDTALWTVRAMVDGQRLDAMGGRQAALDSVLGEIAQTAGDRPWAMSSAAQADLLFGRHRAGLSWWDRNRAARDVDWSTARAWQESVYRPERAHLVVVSPHPPEALAPLAERYLGRMRARSASAPMVPANAARLPSPPARRALALEYDAPVSRADVRCRVPGFGPETAAALLVMDEATSRAAWDSLRSGGGTYAPEVGLASYAPNAGLLSIAADVGAADGGKAAGASVDILRRLASGEEEAFVRAAGRRARADWGRAFDSAPSAFTVLDWAATWGLEPTQLARLGDEILAVDARQVADLLVDCVGHEVISVIGPDAATSLREAGFEAEPYDWLADHERRCASVR
jgi:predicted Zn-dependent peptidase